MVHVVLVAPHGRAQPRRQRAEIAKEIAKLISAVDVVVGQPTRVRVGDRDRYNREQLATEAGGGRQLRVMVVMGVVRR